MAANHTLRNAVLLAGLGGFAYYLFRSQVNKTVSTTLNPASDQNFVYQGANTLVQPFDPGASVGSAIYDASHITVQNPVVGRPSFELPSPWLALNPLAAPYVAGQYAGAATQVGMDAGQAAWAKLGTATSWLASLLNIGSLLP